MKTQFTFGVTDGREDEQVMRSLKWSLVYRVGRLIGKVLGPTEPTECEICGRNDIVTPLGQPPRCSRHTTNG